MLVMTAPVRQSQLNTPSLLLRFLLMISWVISYIHKHCSIVINGYGITDWFLQKKYKNKK
tara:strand:+ start:951 stop:1130 length:180 start_codon:yes stop_codon:yes gene_type:complete